MNAAIRRKLAEGLDAETARRTREARPALVSLRDTMRGCAEAIDALLAAAAAEAAS